MGGGKKYKDPFTAPFWPAILFLSLHYTSKKGGAFPPCLLPNSLLICHSQTIVTTEALFSLRSLDIMCKNLTGKGDNTICAKLTTPVVW